MFLIAQGEVKKEQKRESAYQVKQLRIAINKFTFIYYVIDSAVYILAFNQSINLSLHYIFAV